MTATTSAPRPHGAAHAVRLTRRGRALVVLALAAVLLGAFSLGRTGSQAAVVEGGAATGAAAPRVEQATVQAGESLWSVAQRIAPDHDTREVVQQIQRLNDLEGARLRIGQQLLLPVPA